MPNTVRWTLIPTTLWIGHYYLYFADRKAESQKGYVSWPRLKCSSYRANIQRSILHTFGRTRAVRFSNSSAHQRGGTEDILLLLSNCAFLWVLSNREMLENLEWAEATAVTWALSVFCSVLNTLSDISGWGRCSEQSSLKKNESWQTLGLLAHTPVHRWLEFSNQITWQAISLSCSGTLSGPWDNHIYITH